MWFRIFEPCVRLRTALLHAGCFYTCIASSFKAAKNTGIGNWNWFSSKLLLSSLHAIMNAASSRPSQNRNYDLFNQQMRMWFNISSQPCRQLYPSIARLLPPPTGFRQWMRPGCYLSIFYLNLLHSESHQLIHCVALYPGDSINWAISFLNEMKVLRLCTSLFFFSPSHSLSL